MDSTGAVSTALSGLFPATSTATSAAGAASAADSTGSAGSTGSSSAGGAASSHTTLSQDDFYKIMISELTNQDPFQPLDNQQFLQQLASLQSLDTTARLSQGIDKLVLGQRLASASSLIGHDIHAVSSATADGASGDVRGTVKGVQVSNGEVDLLLDGERKVKLDEVVEIA